MKTKFILILILPLFMVNGQATPTADYQLELTLGEEMPSPRSADDIPAEAFLRNFYVQVGFTKNVTNVTASIINITTGESIFTQTYSSPSDISIDLEGENSGNYKLVMEIDGMVVWGSFNL